MVSAAGRCQALLHRLGVRPGDVGRVERADGVRGKVGKVRAELHRDLTCEVAVQPPRAAEIEVDLEELLLGGRLQGLPDLPRVGSLVQNRGNRERLLQGATRNRQYQLGAARGHRRSPLDERGRILPLRRPGHLEVERIALPGEIVDVRGQVHFRPHLHDLRVDRLGERAETVDEGVEFRIRLEVLEQLERLAGAHQREVRTRESEGVRQEHDHLLAVAHVAEKPPQLPLVQRLAAPRVIEPELLPVLGGSAEPRRAG